jgi:hypothetical protein
MLDIKYNIKYIIGRYSISNEISERCQVLCVNLMVMHVQSIFLFDVYNANKYYSHI